MASSFRIRRPLVCVAAITGLVAGIAAQSSAQSRTQAELSAQVRVPPILQLRPLSRPRVVTQRPTQLEGRTRLEVDANVTYTLRARLPDTLSPIDGVVVEVRNEWGQLDEVREGAAVVVARETARGRTVHDVFWRISASRPSLLRRSALQLEYEIVGSAEDGTTSVSLVFPPAVPTR